MHTTKNTFLQALVLSCLLSFSCTAKKGIEQVRDELLSSLPNYQLLEGEWEPSGFGVRMSIKKFYIETDGARDLAFVVFDVNEDGQLDALHVYDRHGNMVEQWYDFDGDRIVDIKKVHGSQF